MQEALTIIEQPDESLHVSQTAWRTLVESAAQAILMVDADGKVVFANTITHQVFGFDPDELNGTLLEQLLPGDLQTTHGRPPNEFFSSPKHRPRGKGLDLLGRRKNGSLFPIEVSLTRIETGERRRGVSFSDTTRREQIEQAQYRTVFEHMNEGFACCEMIFENGVGVDFIHRAVNARFESLTGLHGVTGKRVKEVLPRIGELDPEVLELYARVSQTGMPAKLERFVNVLSRWCSISAYCPEKGHFVAIFSPADERKRSQEALRQSEERLRLAVESAGLGTFDLDVPTEKLTFCELAKSYFGLPPDAEVDRALFLKAVHPGDRDRVKRKLDDARQPTGGGRYAADFRAIGVQDGKERWISARGQMFFGEDGQPMRFIGILQDLTDRRFAEEALRQNERRLRLAVDAAGLGTFDLNLETGELSWSDILKELFGLPPDAPVDYATFERGLHPEDRVRVQQLVKQALRFESSGYFAAEYRTIGIQDGLERWVSARGQVFFDEQKQPTRFLGVVQDLTRRRQTENALRRSEEGLRLAVDSAGLGTYEFDARTKRRIWSDIAKSYIGLPPHAEVDEVVLQKAVQPEDWNRLQRILDEALRPEGGGQYSVECGFRGIYDLKQRWLAIRGQTFFDEYGQATRMLGVIQDLTGRKRMEDALRQSHEQLRLAVEGAGLGTFELHPQVGIRIWSDIAKRHFGLPPDAEPDEATFVKGLHPEDRERVMRIVEESNRPEKSGDYTMEFRATGIEDGLERWLCTSRKVLFDDYGRPEHVLGITQDVTERRHMEDALREGEERLRLAVEAAGLGTFDLDPRAGKLIFSDHAKGLLGLAPDAEVDTETLWQGLHPDDRQRIRHLTVEAAGPRSQRRYETQFRTIGLLDGKERWLSAWARILVNREGQPERAIGVVMDITEQKRLERVARESRDEIRALAASLLTAQEEERRRVSRELHDGITQELALLAVEIGGLAASPPTRKDAPEKLRALQASAVKASEEARHIAYELHPSVLDDLGVVASLKSLCREFSDHAGLAVEFSGEPLPCAVPREVASCLYRVAQQSLQNTANHANASCALVSLTGKDGNFLLTVEDDGTGFDPEAVRSRGGLGLIGMKERARLVKGELTISSAPGRGTRLSLAIPMPAR